MKNVQGFRGARGKLLRIAKETYNRAMRYSFRDRKAKKREFRALWITRISAALMNYKINYSQFMGALIKSNIPLNRKELSEMAIYDPQGFAKLVEMVKKNLPCACTKECNK